MKYAYAAVMLLCSAANGFAGKGRPFNITMCILCAFMAAEALA